MTDSSPPRARRGPSGPVLALLSLFVSLLAAELFLQLFHPIPDPYEPIKRAPRVSWHGSPYVPSAYPPHYRKRMHAEPGLPGVDTLPRTFSINNLGFRGDSLAIPRPAGEVRVFMVGGSTTECVFLDDREAITRRLQDRLRAAYPGVNVRVYGAGQSGDKSFDHVAMVAHRIIHLQPDVIVVFAGINDVLAGVGGRDYLLRDTLARPKLKQLLAQAATEFQLPRLLVRATATADPHQVDIRSEYTRLARTARARPAAALPAADSRPYEENLRTLAGIARAHGVRMVFITQATTWNAADPRIGRWHWMTGTRARYPEADLDHRMERYNDVMRHIAADFGDPLLDLPRAIPKSADFFYDDVHFNVAGADTAAALLSSLMVSQRVIPRTDATRTPRPPLPPRASSPRPGQQESPRRPRPHQAAGRAARSSLRARRTASVGSVSDVRSAPGRVANSTSTTFEV